MLVKEDRQIAEFIGASQRIHESVRSGEVHLINEFDLGIVGKVFSSLASGKLDALKEYIIDAVFEFLGFTSDSFLGKFMIEVVKEFIENVLLEEPSRVMDYFDDEKGCEILADDLVLVLGKSGGDILINVFVDYIKSEEFVGGLQQDLGSGSYLKAAMGSLTASLVNAISDSIILESISKTLKEVFQNEILEELQPYVRKAICSMPPLSELIGGMLGFGDEEEEALTSLDTSKMTDITGNVGSVMGKLSSAFN
jgi:hypothetical protein